MPDNTKSSSENADKNSENITRKASTRHPQHGATKIHVTYESERKRDKEREGDRETERHECFQNNHDYTSIEP